MLPKQHHNLCLISCAVLLLAFQCANADVNTVNNRRQLTTARRNQAQRLTAADQTAAYPAAGFRPEQAFQLPSVEQTTNNFNNLQQQQQQFQQQQQQQIQQLQQIQQQQQEFIYSQYNIPQQQQKQQQQFQQQQQFKLGPQQFPNIQRETSARLSAEPEEREVVDNNEEDIEGGNVENAAEEVPATRSAVAAPLPPPQATVTYFPANAFNFVKPFQGTANPGATFIQYQPNVVTPPMAKVVAANPVAYPISAQYFASSGFLPASASASYNSYTAFPQATAVAAPAALQAW